MEKLTARLPTTRSPAFAINMKRFNCINGANAFAFNNFKSSSRQRTQSTFTHPAGFSHLGTRMLRHCQSGDGSNVCQRMKRLQSQKNRNIMAIVNANNEDRIDKCTSRDPVLQPNHKIFLSHSGAQKEEFVEQLCVELERRHRFAFYDKYSNSLPKGEKFPELIKAAVKKCQMMVVVVSDEYFKSKWPMIELHAFMQARKKNPGMKLLPLFLGLSVEEFKDVSRHEVWFKEWNTLSKVESDSTRINVDEWKDTLKLVSSYNGIEFNKDSRDIVAFRNEVVLQICKALPADIKLEDSHVQGRLNLCKVILNCFEKLPPKVSKVRVIGIYGVGGIGKTTMCKTLCNELDGEFNAKVCHVELGKILPVELLQKALNVLTDTSLEFAKGLDEDQCRDILWKQNSWKQKTFLAVDNVWDNAESLEQAIMYLRAPFYEGSMVIVTSRFLKTLISLGIDENECFEMPELGKEDAKKLLLYYAADGKQFESEDDVCAIEECIDTCFFRKGGNQGSHYHPLALRVLGVQLHHIGDRSPSEWVKSLPKIKDSSQLQGSRNPLFSILRSNFDRLPLKEQDLFMDLCIFMPTVLDEHIPMQELADIVDLSLFVPTVDGDGSFIGLMEWLCLVHKEEIGKIRIGLQHLKESAVLEDVDVISGRVSMHDLYCEFAYLESEGKLDGSISLEKQRWLYVTPDNSSLLDEMPAGRCWQNLKRVRINEQAQFTHEVSFTSTIPNFEEIEWKYFANVVVLKLDRILPQHGIFNFKGLKCLRSLEIQRARYMNFVGGLEGLKNLTFVRMSRFTYYKYLDSYGPTYVCAQFPASLEVLDLGGSFALRDNMLEFCTMLRWLKLRKVHSHGLSLSNCTSLEELLLNHVTGFMSDSNLDQILEFDPSNVDFEAKLTKLPDLRSFRHLSKLECFYLDILEVPSLSGLVHLQVVNLPMNDRLTSLEGLEDLPALRRLNVAYCPSLRRLPDLSTSTKLEQLILLNTEIELSEEDIGMLARLPLLQMVFVDHYEGGAVAFCLDLVRRKIMCRLAEKSEHSIFTHSDHQLKWTLLGSKAFIWQNWKLLGWLETDLCVPPYKPPFKVRDIKWFWLINLGPGMINGTRIPGSG